MTFWKSVRGGPDPDKQMNKADYFATENFSIHVNKKNY